MIILCLCVPQLMIFAGFISKQLIMLPVLHNASLVKDSNARAEPTGRKPVTDINCRLARYHLIEMRIYFCLRKRIQRRRRFVQNDKRSIFIKRTGKCDFLRFTAGNFNAFRIKAFIDAGLKPLRKCGKTGPPFPPLKDTI